MPELSSGGQPGPPAPLGLEQQEAHGTNEIALIVVLLVTGNALLAVIAFLFLIPTVEYVRRQRMSA